jgi:hypothetical protein
MMTVFTWLDRLDLFVVVAGRHLMVTCVFMWALIGSMCSEHFLSTPVLMCHTYTHVTVHIINMTTWHVTAGTGFDCQAVFVYV